MVEIQVDTNATDVARWVRAVHADQLPFATSLALNRTGYQVRDAIRQGIQDRMTVRRKWVANGVQVPRGGRATKRKLEVLVELTPNRARFLAKFEKGGVKRGTPDAPVAIPTEHIRPTDQVVPPLRLYPKNLRLQARKDVVGTLGAKQHVTRRGVVQLKGKRRTFVIDPQHHRADPELWGVWQRFGPKRHQIRLIWAYRRQVPIPPILHFEKTARHTVSERWARNFADAFDRAAASASRRSGRAAGGVLRRAGGALGGLL